MAEIMETKSNDHMGKINAGLTTGIIGTSLSGLLALGALGLGIGGPKNGQGTPNRIAENLEMGDLYIERKQCKDYIDLTKQYYEGQMATNREIERNFFDLYKMNIDTSFSLYKNHNEDTFKLWKSQIDADFGLYKNQRDEKDVILEKMSELEKKVDVMAAIRPYQDALINSKIDYSNLQNEFNLNARTCRMLTGELVLPSTPTVTGYPSYCCCSSRQVSPTPAS